MTVTNSEKERPHKIRRGIRNRRRRWGKREKMEKGENEEVNPMQNEENM